MLKNPYPLVLLSLLSFLIFITCKPTTIESISYYTDTDVARVDRSIDKSIESGWSIYPSAYIDQPYILKLPDQSWICMYTKSDTAEGALDGRLGISKSYDKGKSWITLPDLEVPSSMYVVPFLSAKGRIYAFYTFNTDGILKLENGKYRSHLIGDMCFKYSDDAGVSWSERKKITIPKTQIDIENPYKGKYQTWWTICKPILADGQMYFAFTKTNLDKGEGFILNSPNINTEANIEKLVWNFLPANGLGIRSSTMGLVQEEHNIVQLNNGDFCSVNRTALGYPAIAYSSDNCKSWSEPKPMTYMNGDTIRNPRACARIFKCSNGKYLLWFENNSFVWGYRNPAWISGGIEQNGKIAWSQPEVILYSKSESNTLLMSYPDLIQDGTDYYISETQKKVARINLVDGKIFNGLWEQGQNESEVVAYKVLDLSSNDLESINTKKVQLPSVAVWSGLTFEIKLKNTSMSTAKTICSLFSENGADTTLQIKSFTNNTYGIDLFANKLSFARIKSNDEKISKEKSIVLSFSIDPDTRVLTGMINGIVFKGDNITKQGWLRILLSSNFNFLFGKNLQINNTQKTIEHLKVYNRCLTISEQISNYNYIKSK